MKRNLSKHYHGLTPDVRFQLALKAAARGDEAEVESLNRTCPKKTYEMNDVAVIDRFNALQRLVSGFLCQMELGNGTLTIHEAIQMMLEHLISTVHNELYHVYVRGLADASKEDGLTDEADVAVKDALSRVQGIADRMSASIRKGILMQIKGDLEAFDTACQSRMGIDVDTVLAGLGGSEVLNWLDRDELTDVESVDFEDMEEAYLDCWDREVSRSAG